MNVNQILEKEKEDEYECPSCKSIFIHNEGFDYDTGMTLFGCDDCDVIRPSEEFLINKEQ